MLSISGVIRFNKSETLSNLFTVAGGQESSARQIYRISNNTAVALKIRQVKFQSTIRANEQESNRQWKRRFLGG